MRRNNTWYWFALLYVTGMAATGEFLRYASPEDTLNADKYVSYLVVLSTFWPITLCAMATHGSDF